MPASSDDATAASSDEALMCAHARGDRRALALLFDRYFGRLLRVMRRDLAVAEEARDLVQQTFLQLHRARADYDPAQRFRPWLYTIALNLKREHLRSRARRPTVPLDGSRALEAEAELSSPEQADEARAVREAIASLPSDQRAVIELHWLDELSFAEVAECLGISANAAKVRAHRGYERLRPRLKRQLA
jgi:RNA polymerase sigma-70 factor (ECF subfamily)